MPRVEVDGLTLNYEVQGEGEPLLLIPYTSADHACWAFQLPSYSEHFSCIAIDLPGAGESDKPTGPYSTDGQADQVAAFLGVIGIERVGDDNGLRITDGSVDPMSGMTRAIAFLYVGAPSNTPGGPNP